MAHIEEAPALPGTPVLEAHRAEVFLRAKADPVLFVRPPSSEGTSDRATRLRASILSSEHPGQQLFEVFGTLRKHPKLGREVLLTDGYLYADSPEVAAALTELVRIEDLYSATEVWMARGRELLRLERRAIQGGSAYFHADGPFTGDRARLFLFDRITERREDLTEPLHRDVSGIRRELGFSELRVRRIVADAILADALYDDEWIPTVLTSTGSELGFECEVVPPGKQGAVASVRDRERRRARVLDRLRTVMREQVGEALPFDEPRTEVGQEDGKLRQHWGWAYRFGRTQFDYNDDRYRVFDAKGRPRVPQVCIDFITDTFERASGSWFRPRGEPRERVSGRLDFSIFGIDNERSVERFLAFAKSRDDWFEVLELAPEERVPYARRRAFFAHLTEQRSRYRPGDVIAIYGLRDDEKMHYHSFFVYDADPVSGVPSLVAGNAGRPRIRPWESEMTSAPKRSIQARIRPRLDWLESVVGLTAGESDGARSADL